METKDEIFGEISGGAASADNGAGGANNNADGADGAKSADGKNNNPNNPRASRGDFSNADSGEVAAFYAQVSAQVRRLREQRGMSQLDLALEIGIRSVAFYSNCENNRYGKHFNLEHIYKLAKALRVPLAELFAGVCEGDELVGRN